MSVDEALYAHLVTQTSITSLVDLRIYPLLMPQTGQLPAIVYQRISSQRTAAHEGPAKVVVARYQFDAFAPLVATAQAIVDAIRLACDGFSGLLGGVDGVMVASILADDEQMFYDDETRTKRVVIDLMITYYEG